MDISLIICTYNRCESLKDTLESVSRMDVPENLSWEVLVVDNNSHDNTKHIVEEFIECGKLNLRYTFEENQGLSYARNTGIKKADGELLAFTDDDVTVDRMWLSNIIKAANIHKDCYGFGGKILLDWLSPPPPWLTKVLPKQSIGGLLGLHDHGDMIKEFDESMYAVCGANMIYRKEAFEEYGLFNTDLSLKGKKTILGEDSEFCIRLRNSGRKIIYIGNAVVYHKIPKEHMTESFLKKRFWGMGQAHHYIDMNKIPLNTIKYFGIPREYLRELMVSFLKWAIFILILDFERRLLIKLHSYAIMGKIYAAYKNKRLI